MREGRDYPVFIINQALYIVGEVTEEQYEKTKQVQTKTRVNQPFGFCDWKHHTSRKAWKLAADFKTEESQR